MAIINPEQRLEAEVEKLKRSNESLVRQLAAAKAEVARKEKHVRDSFLGRIIGGLCHGWDPERLPPRAMLGAAFRLLNQIMEERRLWEAGASPYETPKPKPREAVETKGIV